MVSAFLVAAECLLHVIDLVFVLPDVLGFEEVSDVAVT